jgi:hypothetical protein
MLGAIFDRSVALYEIRDTGRIASECGSAGKPDGEVTEVTDEGRLGG